MNRMPSHPEVFESGIERRFPPLPEVGIGRHSPTDGAFLTTALGRKRNRTFVHFWTKFTSRWLRHFNRPKLRRYCSVRAVEGELEREGYANANAVDMVPGAGQQRERGGESSRPYDL